MNRDYYLKKINQAVFHKGKGMENYTVLKGNYDIRYFPPCNITCLFTGMKCLQQGSCVLCLTTTDMYSERMQLGIMVLPDTKKNNCTTSVPGTGVC